MLNNKGQSLVMFVIFIPIFILILLIVFNIGNLTYKKKKLCNITYEAVYYALSNNDEEKVKQIIYLNDKNIKINNINLNPVRITTSIYIHNNINNIIDLKINNISCTYQGYLKDNKKIVERIK